MAACFRYIVDDVDADLDGTVSRLKSAGSTFRTDVVQGVGGTQILLQNPSGNLVELFEPNPAQYVAPGARTRGAAQGGDRVGAVPGSMHGPLPTPAMRD
ncbi:MAG TPA: hypothetical protein VFQ38_03470 [Longimicrobiales bacterium]|nr:hypothetical protein [Longimicrobiales bacterium]